MKYQIMINSEYTYWHSKDKFMRFGPEPDKYKVCADWTADCDTISTHRYYKEAIQARKKLMESAQTRLTQTQSLL
jgi:hypothetical protein